MAKDPKSVQQFGFLRDEIDAAYLYRAIAERPGHPELAQLYRNLADDEERHAEYWRERLTADGVDCHDVSPTLRTRALAAVARRFGARVLIPVMARREIAEHYAYDALGDDRPAEMVAEEQSHARLVQVARRHHTIEDLDGLELARLQGKPRVVGGNALRAAVLGANDGLVSNTSLVMGVAGAELSARAVLVSGLAGLLAGAISMALGEWISVTSSRELHQFQSKLTRGDAVLAPPEEAEQLALVFQARGIEPTLARRQAEDAVRDMNRALRRGSPLLDDSANGSDDNPWTAALVSFALFALGAVVPVLPFMFTSGAVAIVVAVTCAGAGLFLIGGAITLFTGKPVWWSGGRQLMIGVAAALVTFAIGKLIGINIG